MEQTNFRCKNCGIEYDKQNNNNDFCSDECYTEYVIKNESERISIEFWDWK